MLRVLLVSNFAESEELLHNIIMKHLEMQLHVLPYSVTSGLSITSRSAAAHANSRSHGSFNTLMKRQ